MQMQKGMGLDIGGGKTKICVPVIEKTREAILDKAREIPGNPVDLAEWRADFYEDVMSFDKTARTAELLQDILGGIPLLFTFRTAEEGGERKISLEQYQALLKYMADSGTVDLMDVEVFRGMEKRDGVHWKEGGQDSGDEKLPMQETIRILSAKMPVVGSYHDFSGTPEKEEMISRLEIMVNAGVEIPKLAVMPQAEEDVLRLMDASLAVKKKFPDKPLITMAMGELGAITRIAGKNSGSAVTFGCLGKASAPGQIEVSDLKKILEILDR